MKKVVKPWFVLGLALLLVCPNLACAEQQQPGLTGGLSRVRVGDRIVEIEGGFVRSLAGDEVFVWLLGLSAQIKVFPQKDALSGKGPLTSRKLHFHVANLYPPRMVLEGVNDFKAGAKGINFQLEMAPGQSKQVKLKTLWPKDSFQFVVTGDSRDNPRIFKKLLQQAGRHAPLFLVSCGDIVSKGRREEYKQFSQLIQGVNYPFFIAVGNHDILRRGRRTYHELFGPTHYSFRFADCHFIFLDNALWRLDDIQYRWLRDELAANTHLRSFIFMHIPPFDPQPERNYAMDLPLNTQWFFDLLEEYRVNTVFASHIHGYGQAQKGQTRYVITGGAGAPLDDKESFYHYVLVTVSPGQVKTEVIKVQ